MFVRHGRGMVKLKVDHTSCSESIKSLLISINSARKRQLWTFGNLKISRLFLSENLYPPVTSVQRLDFFAFASR